MRLSSIKAALAALSVAIPALALANPEGAQVVAGSATVQGQGTSVVTIKQSSEKTILNWDSFSIKEGELTKFLQPSAQSIALNRVIGGDPSLIYGTLSANGRLILINPNGLLIGPSGTVNANSLIASTAGISDENFLEGHLAFDRAGNPDARIVNEGQVTATEAGLVAFVAPAVKNTGLIQAKLGTVTLGAATKFTLDFYGDELVSFPIDAEVTQAADGAKALIEAGGRIEGQNIALSARAARDVIDNVIVADGTIIARTATVVDGAIRLGGSDQMRQVFALRDQRETAFVEAGEAAEAGTSTLGGTISVDGGANGRVMLGGTLDASGTTGGQVRLSGEEVHVTGRVLAEGTSDVGGSIEVTGAKLVSFGGLLSANGTRGGAILARVSDGELAIGGHLHAQGDSGSGGLINLSASGDSWETVGATLDASGMQDGGYIRSVLGGRLITSAHYEARGHLGVGGQIDLSATSMILLSATLDASAATQGGMVRIGGEYQGGRDLPLDEMPNADRVYLNDETVVDVSAFGPAGNGGTAVVWSERNSIVAGQFVSSGGLLAGIGGLIESSSAGTLSWLGSVQTARNGERGGVFLLDPKNISILPTGGGGGGPLAFNQLIQVFASGLASSVAIDGPNMVVGDVQAQTVYLFRFLDNNFAGGALVGRIGMGMTGPNDFDMTNSSVGTLGQFDEFGAAVALKGSQLIVGAPGDFGINNTCVGCGAVYLFQFADANLNGASGVGRIGSGYTGPNSFNVANLHSSEDFGEAIAFDGKRLAVSAPDDLGFNDGCQFCGAVYLFEFGVSGSFATTGLSTGIIGSGYTGPRSFDMSGIFDPIGQAFGSAIAFDGNRLVIGASADDGKNDTCFNCGAVYLFSTASNSFTSLNLTGRLGAGYNGSGYAGATSLDRDISSLIQSSVDLTDPFFPDSPDRFGSALGLAGSTLLVGARGDDGAANTCIDCGALYFFDINGLSIATASPGRIGAGYTGGASIDLSQYVTPTGQFGAGLSYEAGRIAAIGRNFFSPSMDVFLFSPGGGGGLNGTTFADSPADELVIGVNTLQSILSQGTSIILQANNDIFFGGVSDPVSLQVDNPNGVGGNLTFLAGRRIFFNGSLFTDGGNFTAVANVGSEAGLFTGNLSDMVLSVFRDAGVAVFNMTPGSSIIACADGTTSCGDVRISLRNGLGQTFADASDINLERILAGSIHVDHLGALRGNINVNNSLTAIDQGASIILASAAGNFSNGCATCGTGLLTTPRGHWLVYGQNPGSASELVGQSLFRVGYNPSNPIGVYEAAPPSPYKGRFLYRNAPPVGYSPGTATADATGSACSANAAAAFCTVRGGSTSWFTGVWNYLASWWPLSTPTPLPSLEATPPLSLIPNIGLSLSEFVSGGVAGVEQNHHGQFVNDNYDSTMPLQATKIHPGLDIAAPIGSAVRAFASGEVVKAIKDEGTGKTLGNRIIVKLDQKDADGSTIYALYAHLRDDPTSLEGQHFNTGDRIASVGNTGASHGPHLHFELRRFPESYLAQNPGAEDWSVGTYGQVEPKTIEERTKTLEKWWIDPTPYIAGYSVPPCPPVCTVSRDWRNATPM